MANNQNEMNWKKFSYVVKQMQSDNPSVRELAVQSLDRMVESEVAGSHLKLAQSSHSEANTSKKEDVMHKIRLLQKDKEKKQVRRKKWFAMI